MKKDLKILIWDIEVLPAKCYIYDLWQPVNNQAVTEYPAIITIAYKWLGEKESKVIVADKPYKDKSLLQKFSKIWSQADYTIAYNGDRFDIKYLAGRVLHHGLPPIAHVKSIDPLKLVKRHFKFLSNSLDYVTTQLGLSNKGKIAWKTWQACAEGDKKALEEVVAYNIQDIVILEELFLKIQPYCVGLSIHYGDCECPSCKSKNLVKRGFFQSGRKLRQRYLCKDCGRWSSKLPKLKEVK